MSLEEYFVAQLGDKQATNPIGHVPGSISRETGDSRGYMSAGKS